MLNRQMINDIGVKMKIEREKKALIEKCSQYKRASIVRSTHNKCAKQ